MAIYIHEMKINLKSLIIWTLAVGGMCFGCILLYGSLEESIQEIADAYANMGAMSAAIGMDKMSLATLTGFYATEVAMMHGLGGAMFAAILGGTLLSKEEAGHTAEFLLTFPVSRIRIITSKYLALISDIALFNIVCTASYMAGYLIMGEDIPTKEMLIYHLIQLVMQIEIGTICFAISAFCRRNLIGAGLGITIMLFAADMMCRIIPAIENVKYITPFYYSNAADIFSSGSADTVMTTIGAVITVISLILAYVEYCRKDIAS